MTQKLKIAAKHLDPCDIVDCKFAHSQVKEINGSMDTTVCCFGLRHEGCFYLNPDMRRNLEILAQVEINLITAKYEADPYWAAKTKNDQIDLPVKDIIEPAMKRIAEITGKEYSFVYAGHEYNHQDNSMDYGSCPHCDEPGPHEHIGYYNSGINRISCFICSKCFEKFYYHKPEK